MRSHYWDASYEYDYVVSYYFKSVPGLIVLHVHVNPPGFNPEIQGYLEYYDCWCPGSLCRQVISSHGIDHAG